MGDQKLVKSLTELDRGIQIGEIWCRKEALGAR